MQSQGKRTHFIVGEWWEEEVVSYLKIGNRAVEELKVDSWSLNSVDQTTTLLCVLSFTASLAGTSVYPPTQSSSPLLCQTWLMGEP